MKAQRESDSWPGDTFAGGVLAGAARVHLLSAGADGFRAPKPHLNLPLAFVLAGVGFPFILLIAAVTDPDPGQSPLHCGSRGASHEVGPHSSESHPFILSFAAGGDRARPGDRVLISGTVGDHGIPILCSVKGASSRVLS